MNDGLYVYSIMVGGSLLAIIWISRRYDVPLYGQAEIAFFFGAFMLWAVIMTGLCSPFQSSVLVAQQNRNPALAVTPSDNRVFLEKFFDTPQHSGQQPSQPALPYAAPESDVLDNEPPMPQMSDTPGGPGSYGPWSQDQTAAAIK